MRRLVLSALAASLLAGCGPKKYVLLSPEEEYSDDPLLSVQVEVVQEVKGRIEVIALVENKGTTELPFAMAEAVLLDSKDKNLPLLAKPSDVLAAGEEKSLLWAFDATGAAKGSLEMKIRLEGKKIWPIIFSPDKPSDFKAPPDQGPMQGPQGGGRPPF